MEITRFYHTYKTWLTFQYWYVWKYIILKITFTVYKLSSLTIAGPQKLEILGREICECLAGSNSNLRALYLTLLPTALGNKGKKNIKL